MQTIEIQKKEVNLREFKRRSALESDCKQLINFECLITEDGKPKILYKKIETDTSKVKQSVKNIKFSKSIRTDGLKTMSRIFGYAPRNPIRKNFCTSSAMSYDHPKENQIICEFGAEISKLYIEYFPEVYKIHSGIVNEKILPEWQIPNTPFTSGIVNKNNPLKYHFDSGNIKDVLSNMIVFKKDCLGGYLACPEYDIMFNVDDNTCILFDGQNILHGVTPIKNLYKSSYRYSIVYYTLQNMWNCLTINDEIIRARSQRVKREYKRVMGLGKPGDLQFDR